MLSGSARRPPGSISSLSQAQSCGLGGGGTTTVRLSPSLRPSWPCRRRVRGRCCSLGPMELRSQACLRACLQGSRAQVLPENSDTPKLHLKFSGAPLSSSDASPEGAGCPGHCFYGIPGLCPHVHEKCSFTLSLHPSMSITKKQDYCDIFLNSEKSSCLSTE